MSSDKIPCGCDESKALKAELLNAELTLKVARREIARVLERIDAALQADDAMEPGEGGVKLLADESEVATCRARLLANGSVDATANWMASHLIARPKAERP